MKDHQLKAVTESSLWYFERSHDDDNLQLDTLKLQKKNTTLTSSLERWTLTWMINEKKSQFNSTSFFKSKLFTFFIFCCG